MFLNFTEGIIEAVKKDPAEISTYNNKEMFTSKRLIDILQENGHRKVCEISRVILETIEKFVINDDLTMGLVKKL